MTPKEQNEIYRQEAEKGFPFAAPETKMSFDIRLEVDRITKWQREAYIAGRQRSAEELDERSRYAKVCEDHIKDQDQLVYDLTAELSKLREEAERIHKAIISEMVDGNLITYHKYIEILNQKPPVAATLKDEPN